MHNEQSLSARIRRELLGKGSALVVTGSSGGRTRPRVHEIDAECVGVAIREHGFDSPPRARVIVGLCGKMDGPSQVLLLMPSTSTRPYPAARSAYSRWTGSSPSMGPSCRDAVEQCGATAGGDGVHQVDFSCCGGRTLTGSPAVEIDSH